MKEYLIFHEETPAELSKRLTELSATGIWTLVSDNPVVYTDAKDSKQKFMMIAFQELGELYLHVKDITHESAPAAADASFTVEGVGGIIGAGIIESAALLTPGDGWAPLDLIDIIDDAASGSGAQIRVDTITGGGGTGPIGTWTLIQGGQDYIGPFTFTAVGGFGVGATFDLNYDVLGSNTYEYSLDGMLFGLANTFDTLGPGDYPVWVRDAEGNTGKAYVRIYTL